MFDYSEHVIDDRYQIIRLLGRGGMGAVYLAKHVIIGRQVAVKFLRADLAEDQEVVKRFYREAQAAAAIGHPNIIEVMDVGVSQRGDPYLVMEYLEGESLADMLARTGPIDLAAACGILEPVLLALKATHEQGIVHRDLKPENIFIAHQPDQPPRVKIIDFGISKFKAETGKTRLTRTGYVLGTPSHISPEQVRGSRDVDHRADLYSVGVVLYEMLTGKLPFEADNYNKLLIDVLTADPMPPQEAFSDFPEEARPLIEKALQKKPDDRFQSATEMLEALYSLGGFEQRGERLSHYATGIVKKSFAGGDLGPVSQGHGESDVAMGVLSEFMAAASPGARSGLAASARRRIGVAIGALALAGIGLWVWASGRFSQPDEGDSDPAPAAVSPVGQQQASGPRSSEAQGILITVKGAPQGATIYYRGAPVPTNPFRVERRETLAHLKVEMGGFEPFVTSFVPADDQVVVVDLRPLGPDESETPGAEAPPEEKKSPRASARKHKPAPAPGSRPGNQGTRQESKKLGESGRGAKYSEEFE